MIRRSFAPRSTKIRGTATDRSSKNEKRVSKNALFAGRTPLTVFDRRATHKLLENPRNVVAVAETRLAGNLGQREIGRQQQVGKTLHAALQHILVYGGVHDALELEFDVAPRKRNLPDDRTDRQIGRDMPLDVFDDPQHGSG